MEAVLQNKVRQKLNGILPSLSRFAMVLTGDEDSGDSLLAVFCARVMFTDILDIESPEFTSLSFGELYKCWLEQIGAGVISTHISEQDSSVYRPGEFPNDSNRLIPETGAFLVGLLPQDRAAILLVYGEGFTYAQAADIIGVSKAELTHSISQACSALAGPDRFAVPRQAAPKAASVTSGFMPKAAAKQIFEPTPIQMDEQGTFISNIKTG